MKKLFLTIIIVAAAQVNAISQSKILPLSNPLVKSYFEKENGRLHGEYTSWHENSAVKVEGQFEDNNRVGIWSVWDTAGNLIVERIYTNNYQYKRTAPEIKEMDGQKLLTVVSEWGEPVGLFYLPLEEKQVLFSSLLWRELLPEDNPILFEDNLFLNTLVEAVNNGDLSTYPNDFCNDAEKNNTKIENVEKLQLHSIKLKEQYVFDNARNVGEFRIIAFSLVMVNTSTNDTINNYWFYFQETISVLGKADISKYQLPFDIKNLNELFVLRYFGGMITKYENAPNFGKDVPTEQKSDFIELYLINLEHDLWVKSVAKQ